MNKKMISFISFLLLFLSKLTLFMHFYRSSNVGAVSVSYSSSMREQLFPFKVMLDDDEVYDR